MNKPEQVSRTGDFWDDLWVSKRCAWGRGIAEWLSVVDLKGVLKNLILGLDNAVKGPNNTFRFPLHDRLEISSTAWPPGCGNIFAKQRAPGGQANRLHERGVLVQALGGKAGRHAVNGLKAKSLLHASDAVVSTWEKNVEYGYPLSRCWPVSDSVRSTAWLEERGIFSRGRFGGWKYEVANIDHSVMQGVE